MTYAKSVSRGKRRMYHKANTDHLKRILLFLSLKPNSSYSQIRDGTGITSKLKDGLIFLSKYGLIEVIISPKGRSLTKKYSLKKQQEKN